MIRLAAGGREFAFTGEHAQAMRGYPQDVDPDPAPEWLYRLAAHLQGGSNGKDGPLAEGEAIAEGRRDTTLASLAGTMRQRGFSEASIFAALSVENETRCEPPLPHAQVKKISRSL